MLQWDPKEAVRHLRASDPRMAALIDRIGPCTMTVSGAPDPFRALLRSIVYQQLSGKAAKTIHDRVLATFPRRTPKPDLLLKLSDETLRGAGLSRSKVTAVRDLASRVLDGYVPTTRRLRNMSDDEIRATLTQVRGVGPWTVEMYLMFWLGRPDILPIGDLGVQKGFKVGWNKRKLPTPAALGRHGRRWAPYRTAAAWYLWKIVDEENGATW